MTVTNQIPNQPFPALEPLTPSAPVGAAAKASKVTAFAEEDGPSFWDLLDIINPLQHIPGINTLYREITGDEIGAVAKVAGGALFGGIIGMGASIANLVLEDATGDDLGGHVMSLFDSDDGEADGTALAEAESDTPDAQQAKAAPVMNEAMAASDIGMPLGLGPMAAAPAAPQNAAPEAPLPANMPSGLAFAGPAQAAQATPPAPPAPNPAQALRQPIDSTFRPFNGSSTDRFMPLPPRGAIGGAPLGLTPIDTPPPTQLPGRATADPVDASPAPAPAQAPAPSGQPLGLNAKVAQEMVNAQGFGDVAHPAIPPTGTAGIDNSWFNSNMMQALQKYEQGRRVTGTQP